jgi:Hypervirulence associated proteins TUDOR domain
MGTSWQPSIEITPASDPGRSAVDRPFERVQEPSVGTPASMSDRFEKGDKVRWSSHGGTAHGVVTRVITKDTEAAGRTVRASQDEPQYVVRSESGSGEAVHKGSALTRD